LPAKMQFPAQAGTHSSAFSGSDKWIPAFAGTYLVQLGERRGGMEYTLKQAIPLR